MSHRALCDLVGACDPLLALFDRYPAIHTAAGCGEYRKADVFFVAIDALHVAEVVHKSPPPNM